MNILLGRVASLYVQNFNKIDKKGRQSSFRLEGNNRILQVFNIYRILESTAPGILKSRAQYDQCKGEVKISRQYRDELLVEIAEEINIARKDDVKDIIVAGDFNQDIESEQIQ